MPVAMGLFWYAGERLRNLAGNLPMAKKATGAKNV
jgi:hypothetical protein